MSLRIGSGLLVSLLLLSIIAGLLISNVPYVAAQAPPRGPWVDEVVFMVVEDEAKAVDMLLKNELQVYFRDIRDPKLFEKVKASPELWYALSYGLYFELTFNPVGPVFPKEPGKDKLNPFAVPRIREAMNYLVDRKYIADEIMGGMAVPRYLPIVPAFPDYARHADVAKAIEKEYSYNLEKARSIIFEEMAKLGAELKEGKWYYKGEPVTLIFLIRIEDQRKAIGDYVASQLEKLGFTVERRYGRSRDLAPLWIRGDPAEGRWHIYTGGWITTIVARDEADNFGFFYTPRGMAVPLWQAYKPDPEFDYIAGRLWARDYTSMEERYELMKKALWLSMKDSVRVWLVNQVAPWPARKEVSLAYDLAAGFSAAALWPYTIRYVGKVGGTVKVASTDIFVDPVNPVDGSNWVYDHMYYDPLTDPMVLPDPYTGLYWPQRVKKAEVYVIKGTPVEATLDWVTLTFVDEITVPTDAWYSWDSEKQEIVYAPPGTTAKSKVVVYFEDGLFDIKMHDGSKVSLADFIFTYIFTFDRADPKSPIYDEAYVPAFEEFRKYFKGFKIISEKPLVIEYYSDLVFLDAEWFAATAATQFDYVYAYGPAPWHAIAIGWLAEANKELAFSSSKAKLLNVEWMNYIAGPSLSILKKYLDKALEEGFIPYEKVLSKYVSKDEAKARYANLKKWYESKGHFLVGTGPFYLDKVDITGRICVIKANREFPDLADKWLKFSEPNIPEVKILPAPTIVPGLPATISISVTFKGAPYRVADMKTVMYIITSPTATLKGEAIPVKDGEWKIELKGEDTSKFVAGLITVDVLAVSKLVGTPVSATGAAVVMSVTEYLLSEIAKVKADYEVKIKDLKTTVDTLTSEIKGLKSLVDSLSGTVSTLSTVAAVAIIIAIVALIAPFVVRRK